MTGDQCKCLMAYWWPAACRNQGWDRNDRALRLEVLSEAVGRSLDTASALNSCGDIDLVKAHLGWLADDVGKTREKGDAEPGERRRFLWLIRKHATAVYEDAQLWKLLGDRFGLTRTLDAIEDLSTGDLWELMITMDARRRTGRRQGVAGRPSNSKQSAGECEVPEENRPF